MAEVRQKLSRKASALSEQPPTSPCADSERQAAGVNPEAKASNLRRLRRLEGQIRGLQKMIEADRYCPDIMVQISAAQEALRTVGRELMRNHLQHCITTAITQGGPGEAEEMFDEIVNLIYKHSR